jgi:hypothetical protein
MMGGWGHFSRAVASSFETAALRPPQDEVLDFLLGRRFKTLMVRSAATPRVSNHVAVG